MINQEKVPEKVPINSQGKAEYEYSPAFMNDVLVLDGKKTVWKCFGYVW